MTVPLLQAVKYLSGISGVDVNRVSTGGPGRITTPYIVAAFSDE